MTEIGEKLKQVKFKIEDACRKAGRDPAGVKLIAVSKTVDPVLIEEAWVAGQTAFGENYVQELLTKMTALEHLNGIKWHFIGHLQRNKVKYIVGKVEMIQSVDSVRLVHEIDKRAGEKQINVNILIQVNVGEEGQKGGSLIGEVDLVMQEALKSKWITVKGLMAIPPFESDPENSRKWFIMLRNIRDSLGGEKKLPELSMGMSSDFHIAIEEGATIVRVGTAIFGERK